LAISRAIFITGLDCAEFGINDPKKIQIFANNYLHFKRTANLLGNQKEGTLLAIASFVKKGKAVSVVRTVVSGTDGKLIADVTTSHVLSQWTNNVETGRRGQA
jgi:hypothetical protein